MATDSESVENCQRPLRNTAMIWPMFERLISVTGEMGKPGTRQATENRPVVLNHLCFYGKNAAHWWGRNVFLTVLEICKSKGNKSSAW